MFHGEINRLKATVLLQIPSPRFTCYSLMNLIACFYVREDQECGFLSFKCNLIFSNVRMHGKDN